MARTDQFTAEAVHDALAENLKHRPDLGLRNALAERVLESRNPFEPEAARPPQRWFVVVGLLALLALACFGYYDLLQ